MIYDYQTVFNIVVFSYNRGLVSGPPAGTKIVRCSSPTYKQIYNLYIVYFKKSLDYNS